MGFGAKVKIALLSLLQGCLAVAKQTIPFVVSLALKTLGAPAGVLGWIIAYFAKKELKEAADVGEDKIDNAIDKVEDTDAVKQLKAEMLKPKEQIDWDKVDRLEREILEGK